MGLYPLKVGYIARDIPFVGVVPVKQNVSTRFQHEYLLVIVFDF